MRWKQLPAVGVAFGTLAACIGAWAGPARAAVPVRGTFTPVDPVRVLDTRDGTGVADHHAGPLGARPGRRARRHGRGWRARDRRRRGGPERDGHGGRPAPAT